MTTPLVSVVMACYNAEKTLMVAIDSILNQTLHNLEFIIVNDGSTDQTTNILNRYANMDRRILVIRNPENRGQSWCRNRAVERARGRYIASMDADDYSFPERLARQVRFMDACPNIDVLGTAAELVGTTGQHIGILVLPAEHAQIVAQRYIKPLLIHPTVLFRADFFNRFGLYNESLRSGEDLDLWLRARHSATYRNLPDILLRYTYKPKKPVRAYLSDLGVQYRHIRSSGELFSKGYELVYFALRYVWVHLTNRKR